MDIRDTYQFIILAVLLALSAFFSSTETALMSVNRIRLRALSDDGNKRAALALDILENHTPKMLSAILIGNNIVNVYASSLATTLAYHLGGYMVSIATLALTVAILVFGEITPKNYATINSEKITLRYITVIHFLMTVMTPVIFVINLISRFFLYILRVNPDDVNNVMTEEELRTIVDVSHEDGVIESDEKKMIYNVFDLGDADAKDIMVPRVNMTFIDIDANYEELMEKFRKTRYTRFPVYQDSKDNVVGIVNIKDLLLEDEAENFSIKDHLRKPLYTFEAKKVSELMLEMRKTSNNIAVVLDEYGTTAGLITLEDILEEIVGDIRDEYDADEEKDFVKLGHGVYLVDGAMSLDDVNDRLGLSLYSEDYDSIGGLMIEKLDHIPVQGELVTVGNIRLSAHRVNGNRIKKVCIQILKTDGKSTCI